MPSLNRNFLESIWDKCFEYAVQDAEDEMGKKCELTSLYWSEVFEVKYILPKDNQVDL